MVESACWICDQLLTDSWIFYESEAKLYYLLDVLSVSDFWREINVNKRRKQRNFHKTKHFKHQNHRFEFNRSFLATFSTNFVANIKAFHLFESKIPKTKFLVENHNWRKNFLPNSKFIHNFSEFLANNLQKQLENNQILELKHKCVNKHTTNKLSDLQRSTKTQKIIFKANPT